MGKAIGGRRKRKKATKGWGDENIDNHPGIEDVNFDEETGKRRITQKLQEAQRRRRRREQELKYDRMKYARFEKAEPEYVPKQKKKRKKKKKTPAKNNASDSEDTEPEDLALPPTGAAAYEALLAGLQEAAAAAGAAELGGAVAAAAAARAREGRGEDGEEEEENGEEEEEAGILELTEEEFKEYKKKHPEQFSENGGNESHSDESEKEEEDKEPDKKATPLEEEEEGEEEGEEGGDPFAAHFLARALSPAEAEALGAPRPPALRPAAAAAAGGKKQRGAAAAGAGEEGGGGWAFSTRDGAPLPAPLLRGGGGGGGPLGPHVAAAVRKGWGEAPLTPLQAALRPAVGAYWDVLCCAAGAGPAARAERRRLYAAHALNHLLKARGRVLKHNKLLRKKAEQEQAERKARELDAAVEGKGRPARRPPAAAAAAAAAGAPPDGGEERCQDQGFTRPRCLVLLPTRHAALLFIEDLISLLGPNTSVVGLDRFQKEFGVEDEEDEEKEGEGKPADWRDAWGGNPDDDFRLGLTLTPGQGKGKGAGKGCAARLYAEFYRADLVLASPLGLHLAMGGEAGGGDFLSSVELLVVDQADVLLMQNWSNVQEVVSMVNQMPKKDHNTDFSRVRPYFLENHARFYRQNLIFSDFQDPMILNLFSTYCRSAAGKLKMRNKVEKGSIRYVAVTVKQIFQEIECASFQDQDDSRFEFFEQHLLPKLLLDDQEQTLVFIPSYFDFVRVRNLLMKKEAAFAAVHEYARPSEVARGRARFFHGRLRLLLYTGRAHHARRLRLRGARHLLLYAPPEYCQFYPELVNLLEEATVSGQATTCMTLFTKYEKMALERIVGSKRCKHMLQSEKRTFLFC